MAPTGARSLRSLCPGHTRGLDADMPVRSLIVALVLSIISSAPAQTVPPSIVADGVPPIPREMAQRYAKYRRIPGAAFEGWFGGRREMLLLTRSAETTQVFCVVYPGAPWTQLTFFRERAVAARPR